MQSVKPKPLLLLLLWIIAPFVIETIGFLTHTNPLGLDSPWGFIFAIPTFAWMARRASYHAGKTPGVPCELKQKIASLCFGIARTFEIVILIWLPLELFNAKIDNDWVSFVIIAKLTVYLNFVYWLMRLSAEIRFCDEES